MKKKFTKYPKKINASWMFTGHSSFSFDFIVMYNYSDEVYNIVQSIVNKVFDENGKVVIEELRYGKYYIIEKEAVTGFVITEEKVYFEIKEDGKIVKAEMTNRPILGTLEFTKVDISTSEPLPNTLIEIYNENEVTTFYSSGNFEKCVYDNMQNLIYYQDIHGKWEKFGYDENGNMLCYQNDSGYWEKYS